MIKTWKKGRTFSEIADEYVSHLVRATRETSQQIMVVFDGYLTQSTKDHTHTKRTPVRSLEMIVREDIQLDIMPDVFLSNPKNKQGFIDLLVLSINQHPRLTARKCVADADRSIVCCAIDCLRYHSPVAIKADDSDILVLCLAQPPSTVQGLFLTRCGSTYDVWKVQKATPSILIENILVLHGFFGCDTTSGFFGRPSKKTLLMDWSDLSEELQTMRNRSSEKEEIHSAGMKLTAALYGCSDELNKEREQIFKRKCFQKTTKKRVNLATLPPTEDALKLHAERAFLQVQEWQGHPLDPTLYGWALVDGKYQPIPMVQQPAPSQLMEIRQCGCKTGCTTKRCSCFNSGNVCSTICNCVACENRGDGYADTESDQSSETDTSGSDSSGSDDDE